MKRLSEFIKTQGKDPAEVDFDAIEPDENVSDTTQDSINEVESIEPIEKKPTQNETSDDPSTELALNPAETTDELSSQLPSVTPENEEKTAAKGPTQTEVDATVVGTEEASTPVETAEPSDINETITPDEPTPDPEKSDPAESATTATTVSNDPTPSELASKDDSQLPEDDDDGFIITNQDHEVCSLLTNRL